jgi:hypothetical protein
MRFVGSLLLTILLSATVHSQEYSTEDPDFDSEEAISIGVDSRFPGGLNYVVRAENCNNTNKCEASCGESEIFLTGGCVRRSGPATELNQIYYRAHSSGTRMEVHCKFSKVGNVRAEALCIRTN